MCIDTFIIQVSDSTFVLKHLDIERYCILVVLLRDPQFAETTLQFQGIYIYYKDKPH
jgi:hypothetical protein